MQNTSTTNRQTTVPYDVSLRPNTTCANSAYPRLSNLYFLPSFCALCNEAGVPGAQVPEVPGPALGAEPVCGEQLHAHPAAGGASRAVALEELQKLRLAKYGNCLAFQVHHYFQVGREQSCCNVLQLATEFFFFFGYTSTCIGKHGGLPRRCTWALRALTSTGVRSPGLPALQLRTLAQRSWALTSLWLHAVMWSTGYNTVRPGLPHCMRGSLPIKLCACHHMHSGCLPAQQAKVLE